MLGAGNGKVDKIPTLQVSGYEGVLQDYSENDSIRDNNKDNG